MTDRQLGTVFAIAAYAIPTIVASLARGFALVVGLLLLLLMFFGPAVPA